MPFEANRFDGIFSEHCFEHFEWDKLLRVLKECHRILRPHGVLRSVVPGLELYVDAYQRLRSGKDLSPEETPFLGDAKKFARVFYSGHDWSRRSGWVNDGHHFIHDYESFSEASRTAGFGATVRWSLKEGQMPQLLIDEPMYAAESLYTESYK
jgi:SAM-dependent methyltransferase